MTDDHRDPVSALYLRVVDLDADERSRILDRECLGDPELRARVESLISHGVAGRGALNTGGPIRQALDALDRGPDRIGPYRLLEKLGEGGMGVVYRAAQEAPIRREVAVKLLKRGLETRQALQRFESEYQVLAMLDHPGIGRVLDAGATRDGRPYFVMDLVSGKPLDRFCRDSALGLEDRLGLFLQLCDAVQHAHQKAIIHRDIKPSNVIVAAENGRPIPKIIDFGIAKALAPAVRKETVTEIGQAVGTLGYMSPEQAEGDPLGVDVRTDVYSLGAVLYELMTDAPPVEPERLRNLPFDRARQLVAHEDPPLPSERVADGSRANRLAGDLDAIAMKALEKRREDRYDSVHSLAADLRRHLRHEPVEARPWTTLYRLRKVVRRHRIPVLAAATLALLLVAFSVAVAFQARQAALERDRAEEVSEFLVRFYEAPVYVRGRHDRPSPMDVLTISANRIEGRLMDRPALAARLTRSMGRMFGDIGALDRAEALLDRARDRFAALGMRREELAALHDLGIVQMELGRTGAVSLLNETLARREALLGKDDPALLWPRVEMGGLLKKAFDYPAAERLLQEAVQGLERTRGPDDGETLLATSLLAATYLDEHRLDEAEAILEGLIPRLDEGLNARGLALYNLASVHAARGESEPAIRLLRRAMDAGLRFGIRADLNWHPLLDDPEFIELAKVLEGEKDEASLLVEVRRQAALGNNDRVELLIRTFIEQIPLTERSVHMWRTRQAEALMAAGRYEEALPILEEVAEYVARTEGPGSGMLDDRRMMLVNVQLALGNREAALSILEEMKHVREHPQRLGWHPSWAQGVQDAIRGETGTAMRNLYQAARLGMSRMDWLEGCPALAGIRGTPGYERVVEEVRRRTWNP